MESEKNTEIKSFSESVLFWNTLICIYTNMYLQFTWELVHGNSIHLDILKLRETKN